VTAFQLAVKPLLVTALAARVVGALNCEVVWLPAVELALEPVAFTARTRA
jgi:hypothetical protein